MRRDASEVKHEDEGGQPEIRSHSIGEVLDLLAEFGIESPVDYEDYLKGFETLKKVFPSRQATDS